MKFISILFAAIAMSLSVTAQKPYSISKDDQTGQTIFKGPMTLADLQGEPSFTWWKRSTEGYTPDPNAIAYLKSALPAFTIVTIMGTWCDDSQNLVPKLAKVLSASGFPMERFAMFGVDRAKETGGIESKVYAVKRVPTIVVFKNNNEVGRIVESVNRSVELDLAQIVQKAGQ